MGLRRVSDRAFARLSMGLLGLVLVLNGAVLLHDGAGRYTKHFVTESYDPGSVECQPDAGGNQVCSGTPFRRYGHDERRYTAAGILLLAGGSVLVLLGGFLAVYQLVRWAPERAGPSFMPPVPKGSQPDPPADPAPAA